MPRFMQLGMFLVRCVLLAAPVAAFGADPAPQPPVSISSLGRVVDPAGKPVAGARVVLREWSGIRYSEDVYSTKSDVLAETTSDADGNFRFDHVQAPPFVRHEQYAAPWDVVAFAKGYGPAWRHLAKREDTTPLELQLHAGRQITGRLVDESGLGITDCRVQVVGLSEPTATTNYDYSEPSGLEGWRSKVMPSVVTDREGAFALEDMSRELLVTLSAEHPRFERGVFEILPDEKFLPAGFPPAASRRRGGPQPPPAYASGATHKLKPGGQIRGTVVYDDSSKPAAGAKVSLVWKNMGHFTQADGAGKFKFDSMPLATFDLSSLPEDREYLGERSRIEFSPDNREQAVVIKHSRGEHIRGRVVDADTGAGVPGVAVAYVPANPVKDSNWSPARSVESTADGSFEIVVPLGPGQLRVGGGVESHPTHDVPNYWRWRSGEHIVPGNSAAIDVAAGEEVDALLQVTRGLIVRGQVVDATGKPIPLVRVEALDRFSSSGEPRRTHTDESGRFELAGFPPHEERRINISDEVGRRRTGADIAADPEAGPTRVIDLGAIELRGTAAVSGTVVAGGQPLAGASVHLSVHSRRGDEIVRSRQDAVVTTDQSGKYSIDDVTTDEEFSLYVVCRGYTNQGTKTYRLSAGETVEIPTVELKKLSAAVGGIVVDLDGNPVANVTIVPWERNSYASVPFGPSGPPPPTGADGRFLLTELPNVPLKLMAYMKPPADSRERRMRFPATVFAEPGQMDIRIKLDPKLQRPLP
ncbi:MAG: carboxypeptidase regulatory-like domain-containing protein [Pirellulales bacterium]